VGNHVIYNNKVYKCITACSAGSWATNQSCFQQTTLTKAVTDLNASLTKLQFIQTYIDIPCTTADSITGYKGSGNISNISGYDSSVVAVIPTGVINKLYESEVCKCAVKNTSGSILVTNSTSTTVRVHLILIKK
jgi:hypothetical protein